MGLSSTAFSVVVRVLVTENTAIRTGVAPGFRTTVSMGLNILPAIQQPWRKRQDQVNTGRARCSPWCNHNAESFTHTTLSSTMSSTKHGSKKRIPRNSDMGVCWPPTRMSPQRLYLVTTPTRHQNEPYVAREQCAAQPTENGLRARSIRRTIRANDAPTPLLVGDK